MKKSHYFLILFILVSISGNSQSKDYSSIKGIVINADSVIIPFANVAIKNESIQTGARADENGNFIIGRVAIGEHLLFANNYGKDSTIYIKVVVTNIEVIDLKSVILFEKGDTQITTYPPPKILRD